MTSLCKHLLELAIVLYGGLIIVGRGPGLANGAMLWIFRTTFGVVGALVRIVIGLIAAIGNALLQFIFYRPR